MTRPNADADATLEYGQSHDLARQFLPITLVGIVIGLFLMTPLDGSEAERDTILVGGAVVALSLVLLAVAVYRRTQPSVPAIVLSREGVIFRDLSEKLIPWNEIRAVGEARISASRDFFSTRVTSLTVSNAYYRTLSGGRYMDSVIARDLDPAEIYISYYHAIPVEQFRRAALLRWHAFSRHAEGAVPPPLEDATAAATPSDAAAVPERQPTIQSPSSFQGLRAFGALLRASSPGQLLVTGAAIAGIVALLANSAGLWSTQAQERGRIEAAKWRAWQEKFDRDRAATDEEQRRLRQDWEKTFECMDEYWALHEHGTYKQDPPCMKKTE